MSELEELKRKAAELNAAIERLERAGKELKGPWVPKQGEDYYFVDSDDEVLEGHNDDTQLDKGRIAMGNCHRTKELAEAASLRRKANEAKKYSYAEAKAMAERGELWTVDLCHGVRQIGTLAGARYNVAIFFGTQEDCWAWLRSDQCKAFDVVDEG